MNQRRIDTMIDLETLGQSAGCVILSIGAVEFDWDNKMLGREFYVNIDLRYSMAQGARLHADTLLWWLDQSDEAIQAWRKNPDPVPPHVALTQFAEWLNKESYVWSHGEDFDIPILSHAYAMMGAESAPWDRRRARDTRTVFDMAGMEKMPKNPHLAHHALNDAKHQALYTMEAIRMLKPRV